MGDPAMFEMFPGVMLWRVLLIGVGLGIIAISLLGRRGWRTPAGLLVGVCSVMLTLLSIVGFVWNGVISGARVSSAATLMW